MDNLGLGYGLGLTCSDDFNDKVDEFYPDIADEATRVILWLDSGKIIITGHSGEYRGIEYDDNRSTKEKEPTCYKRQKSKKVVAVLVVNTANKRFNQGRKQQACAPSPLILACSPVKRGVMCTRSCSEY
ncbi:MAG: hypothetical protein ACTH4U_17505 [Pseudoalteromonas prydzensis]|uniref:hypothetical protein n=1 Tax=Pseudoalteromonas prydzensis TaxID=182141 RepID=UPI003F9BDD8D